MLDRETIETTLQQIRSGQLSPEQATAMLLGEEHAGQEHAGPSESIAQLVDRLGPPPPEVAAAWCDQLHAIARDYWLPRARPIPPVDPAAYHVDDHGGLVPPVAGPDDASDQARIDPPRLDEDAATDSTANQCEQLSAARIDAFRQSLLAGSVSDGAGQQPLVSVSSPDAEFILSPKPDELKPDELKPDEPKSGKLKRAPVQSVAFALALVGCIIAGVAIWIWSAGDDPDAMAQMAASDSVPRPVAENLFDPNRLPEDFLTQDVSIDASNLETMESMTEQQVAAWEAAQDSPGQPENLRPTFSLDSFMPIGTEDAKQPDAPETVAAPHPSSATPVAPQLPSPDLVEAPAMGTRTLDDETPEPDEVEQPTQLEASGEPTRVAIELPAVGTDESADQAAPISILAAALDGPPALDFPYDIPIEMSPAAEPQTWTIRDVRKSLAIAQLASTPNGVTFAWQPQRESSAVAKSLFHGRIRDVGGNQIHLRPLVTAEPLAIRLDSADLMPTWDLRSPIPPRVTKIEIRFQRPDDVEEAWIEPVDPDAVRRGRAMAVLTCPDYEGVSLGVRFDVRTSRKLSLRMRYAARLDSSMPWQLVSRPLLTKFNEQLDVQAGLVAREADRLDGVHDMAGTMGRRIIRVKQKRNDAIADNIKATIKATSQLETLIAKVESGVTVDVRLFVQWPDAEQTIFTTIGEESDD